MVVGNVVADEVFIYPTNALSTNIDFSVSVTMSYEPNVVQYSSGNFTGCIGLMQHNQVDTCTYILHADGWPFDDIPFEISLGARPCKFMR